MGLPFAFSARTGTSWPGSGNAPGRPIRRKRARRGGRLTTARRGWSFRPVTRPWTGTCSPTEVGRFRFSGESEFVHHPEGGAVSLRAILHGRFELGLEVEDETAFRDPVDRRSDGERLLLRAAPLGAVELVLGQLPDVISRRGEPQVLDHLVLEGIVR